MKRLIIPSLLLVANTSLAAEWEIKTDLKFTEGATSDKVSFEADGSFDERKIKQKDKTKLKTILSYTEETDWDGLKYSFRLGNIIESSREKNREFREDGSLKKDKSLTETERSNFIGVGLSYKFKDILGAYQWAVKGSYDHLFHINYGAKDLRADAKERSGDLKGSEWAVKATGEYGTPWDAVFFSPYFKFKQERREAWLDDIRKKQQEEEKERKTEIGLIFDWIPPMDGWEVNAGPYWQNEVDYERLPGESWVREDDERWIAQVKAEYESTIPGLELELVYEQHLNGGDQGEQLLNFELSYEF